jgi:hypothetical protein
MFLIRLFQGEKSTYRRALSTCVILSLVLLAFMLPRSPTTLPPKTADGFW